MPRHHIRPPADISPVLRRLIHAAKHAGTDASGRDIRGAAEALRDYGDLALWVVPVHGLFVPNLEPVSIEIERVAKRHLALGAARGALREALRVVERFEHREPIESAVTHVQTVSDEAYFYAGVACGVTLADVR